MIIIMIDGCGSGGVDGLEEYAPIILTNLCQYLRARLC